MFIKSLSANLLILCDEKNISQFEAAELCNISERYFNSIVCEKVNPSIETLEKICNGFNVSANELLYRQFRATEEKSEEECLFATSHK